MIIIMQIKLIYKELGRRLRKARKDAHLTQNAVAERVGLSRTSITNIEKGRQHIPIHTLMSLADAVGVHPEELLPDKETYSKPDILDQKTLKETPLKIKDVDLDWLTTVVSSGISKEESNESD